MFYCSIIYRQFPTAGIQAGTRRLGWQNHQTPKLTPTACTLRGWRPIKITASFFPNGHGYVLMMLCQLDSGVACHWLPEIFKVLKQH